MKVVCNHATKGCEECCHAHPHEPFKHNQLCIYEQTCDFNGDGTDLKTVKCVYVNPIIEGNNEEK